MTYHSKDIKTGDYVKVLNNGAFHNIVQIKNVYAAYIQTTSGIYSAETLTNVVNKELVISGRVHWEDKHGIS